MTELQKLCIIVLLQLLLAKSKGEQINLLQTIKSEVVTSMSSVATYKSQHSSWDSRNAIDNGAKGDPNTCSCCAGTTGSEPPWLQIDLGNIYSIREIQIVGRADGSNSEQYENIYIFVSNSSMEIVNGTLVYKGNTTERHLFKLPLQPPTIFQYMIIRRFTQSYLTICEVKLFEARPTCDIGKFGQACSQHCYCADEKSCDFWTGKCERPGCLPGWKGPACNIECESGFYGDQCNNRCGKCVSGHNCNNVNGSCIDGCMDGYIFQPPADTLCKTTCKNGFFGYNCSQFCGHCANGDLCNISTGSCMNGCTSGYNRPLCKTKCTNNTFGPNCVNQCHCINNSQCDVFNGNCSIGCNIGWSGFNCSKDLDILRRKLISVTTTQSQMYKNCYADRAIDGIDSPSFPFTASDVCAACSVALSNPSFSWWQLDFGTMFLVKFINIIGRTPYFEEQSRNIVGYISNISIGVNHTGTKIPINSSNGHEFPKDLSKPRLFRFLKIEKHDTVLTLCEVSLYEADCQTGWFGDKCLNQCQCADEQNCDNVKGTCVTPGCLPGWKGKPCNQSCNHGYFGADCKYRCHCFDNASCAKDTGVCRNDRCEAGWELSNCSKDGNLINKIRTYIKTELSSADQNTDSTLAVDGLLGPDPDICHCCSITSNSPMSWWQLDLGKRYPLSKIFIYGRNKEDSYKQLTGLNLILLNNSIGNSHAVYNETEYKASENVHTISLNNALARYMKIERPGVLTVCEVIVIEGHCKNGTFGDECSQYCHCADNRPCDQLYGYCQSPICKLGWIGNSCTQSCPQNTFGEGCSKLCYCEDDTCSSDYGICPGKCKTGYRGAHCNIAYDVKDLPEAEREHHTSAVIIGGSMTGGIGVIVVLVVLFVCCHKHRTKRSKSQSEEDNYYKTINRNMTQHDDELYDTIGISEEFRGQVYEGGNQTTSGL